MNERFFALCASRKILAIFALTLLGASAQQASAGPPFVTDDPEPVEFKHWELYVFAIYNHPPQTDTGQFPAIEFNYGVVPNVQLHLIAPLTYDREGSGSAQYGYGDTELGIKYRFIQESDYVPMVGTFPLVELPTGDASRGLGNGYTQVFVPIWLQKSFGKNKEWTSFGGGGFWYNPGDDHRNFWRMGIELQRDLNEHLTLGGEVYHETPNESSRFASPSIIGQQETTNAIGVHGHTAFNLGGYYNFDDHHHLLFTAGRDIDGRNRFACYVGFQWTY